MGTIRLKKTNFQSELIVHEEDLEWETEPHEHYKLLVSLHHIPTGERITQATNLGLAEGKRFCLRELQTRLCSFPEEERFCEWCHKKIEGPSRKQKYCGDLCRNNARAQGGKGKNGKR